MMQSEYVFLGPEGPSSEALTRRRRFKIFEGRSKTESKQEEEANGVGVQDFNIKNRETGAGLNRKERLAFAKIPTKESLQRQFYAQDEQNELVLLQPNLQGYCTVGSQKFGMTDPFPEVVQPSVLFKNNSLVINEASVLYKSVCQLKSSFHGFGDQANVLAASVSLLGESMSDLMIQSETGMDKLRKLEQFLGEMREENKHFEGRLEELSKLVDRLQMRRTFSCVNLAEAEQEEEEMKGFMERRRRAELQEDQFVETQFLPAHVIAEFMQRQRKQAEKEKELNSRKIEEQRRISNIVKNFHPCLNITSSKYSKLLQYIVQEFPNKTIQDIHLDLLFRRGTVDLDCDWIGDKSSLEYKQCLLFILRNSMGKCLGGFLSNILIEEEVRDDPHAFLFSLKEDSYKFKVKQQSQGEAFEASKHYMVCFGSDLMISSECLQEQSYCEWPSCYAGKDDQSSMAWLAGDFSFMIQHIQVYEVLFQ